MVEASLASVGLGFSKADVAAIIDIPNAFGRLARQKRVFASSVPRPRMVGVVKEIIELTGNSHPSLIRGHAEKAL